jgi:glycosyltransferase involved in cell wall biosynthesis
MDVQIIHVVLGKANPERMNGVNKVVNSLATFQTNLGYNAVVWGITKSVEHNFPPRNYETRLFTDRGKFVLDPDVERCLAALTSPVIFHIHGGFIPQFYAFVKQLVAHGKDYVYTPHGAYNAVAMQRSSLKKKLYVSLFESYIVSRAKCVHFIGESEVLGAEKVFGKIDFSLIPNGQNTKELRNDFRSVNDITKPIFGFVGRLDIRTKGLDILFKGFSRFLSRSQGTGELWVIGDGRERGRLDALCRTLGIQNHVRFFGKRFGDEKLNLMANMDYLCLTSRNEGLPGVVLEASALGVPSIVSAETNMGSYLTDNEAGLCLSKNRPEELCNALWLAYRWQLSGKKKQLGANAYAMVSEVFNWNVIAKQLIDVYEA